MCKRWCEHCVDIKKSYADAKKGKEKGSEDLEVAKKEWLTNKLPEWSAKLEKTITTDIEVVTYADIRFYDLYADFFDDIDLSMASIENCPKLKQSVNKVSENAKDYLSSRPQTKF
mmetsp:Transcript_26704/g.34695  ORF Transcript_26704/g.34695 Transcript_26704/m.34695 type:complete len:115 (+) Transcript_26704:180-524(+)